MPAEIETKLVILGDESEAVLKEIASYDVIGMYKLQHGKTKKLQDTYFDTPAKALSGQGIALRTREQEGSVVICIKKDERTDEHGTTHRDETELPWSSESLASILKTLPDIPVPTGAIDIKARTPRKYLEELGLISIHERQTQRHTMDVVSLIEPEKGIIAEIALDKVNYLIGGSRILHYEIEVEAKAPGAVEHIVHLTDFLRKTYGDRIMPWVHNKLLTGFAMEQLYFQGKLSVPSGEALSMSRDSYNAINGFLKHAS